MGLNFIAELEALLQVDSPRLSWDEQAMLTAGVASGRSSCPRARNGAAITLDQRIAATGWNSPPRGLPNCDHPETEICKTSVHAEMAAILWAARVGTSLEDGVCYATTSPCSMCAMALIQAGVTRVMYYRPYRDLSGIDLLVEAGVVVEQMEIWKPIGHQPNYEVSSLGRVRSLWGNSPKTIAIVDNGNGYKMVVLRGGLPGRKQKSYTIHRLVLEAFVGLRPEGMEARHLDGDPSNNHLSNLKWGTPIENANDRKDHGNQTSGSKIPQSKLTEADIPKIRGMLAKGLSRSYVASYYDVSVSSIRNIAIGKTWKHIE
jgi:deoxycytidylate deaminase